MPEAQTQDPDKTVAGFTIAGTYKVHADRPMPDAGAGLAAFVATDRTRRRVGLMAQACLPDQPPRQLPLSLLAALPVEGVLCPIGHGTAPGAHGLASLFVVTPAPPGPSVGRVLDRPWTEAELLGVLLRPVAATLDRLHQRHMTHRAIRPDNVFTSGAAGPGGHAGKIVLGSAWAGPPAALQPALYEPPYSAMCHPCGRGEGSIADDVYALGVVMVTLALGRAPLAGLSDAAIIRRKLELGSYAAIVGTARLPPVIADLARGMLAEDPDHRPPPALLADPIAARARRVAGRPPRRAQAVLEIGRIPVWTARTLAYAISILPEPALRVLRDGSAERWLRRSLGDPVMAVKMEEAVRHRAQEPPDAAGADDLLALRAVALLDPLAPLSWRGVTLRPDGLGTLLAASAAAPPTVRAALQNLIENEALVSWAALSQDTADLMDERQTAYQHLAQLGQLGWAGGLDRLRYSLNPLLACSSPHLAAPVNGLAELLPALNQLAARPDRPPLPIDAQVGAYLAARSEARVDGALLAMDNPADPAAAALAQLQHLADLQRRLFQPPMPGLAAWLGKAASPRLDRLHNRTRRQQAGAELEQVMQTGDLSRLFSVLDGPGRRQEDAAGLAGAEHALRTIDAELKRLESSAQQRIGVARRASQELVLSLGFVLLAVLMTSAVLG